jgi:ArsR family transcriptional regulator, arsenate/arsenite/antimonite-responsive transcriptional repressor
LNGGSAARAAPREDVEGGKRTMSSARSTRERITETDEELASLAKALGHPARVAILRQLAEEGTCVCGEIVDALPLAQATVSQHLKVLKDAGFVQGEIDGPRVCYCVNPRTLKRFRKLVDGLPTNEE